MNKDEMRRSGRIIGVLLLLQALLAIPVYTQAGMMRSVIMPEFLTNAAADVMKIRVAALLTLVLSGLTLAAAIIAMPIFRRHSERMAYLFLALSIIGPATQAIEAVATRDMVAMSVMYATPAAQKEILDTMGALARSRWSSAHFTNLMFGHIKAFVFFLILYRLAFVPRALAGAGIAATLLSITAVTAPLLGYPFSYFLIMPTGLIQLALTLWLIVRGFEERQLVTA